MTSGVNTGKEMQTNSGQEEKKMHASYTFTNYDQSKTKRQVKYVAKRQMIRARL